MRKFFCDVALALIVPIGFLWVWHTCSLNIQNEVVLPKIANVLSVLSHPQADLFNMGSLSRNVIASLVRVLTGYFIAVVLAVPLGLLMGYSKTAYKMLDLFFGLFRPIPALAWIPLVLAWFGVASMATVVGIEEGEWYPFFSNIKLSMIFIIFLGAFFATLGNTVHGVRNVRVTLVESTKVLGATRLQIAYKIVLPAAAPQIFTGMRAGLSSSWTALVGAEMMPGSISGVGYLITHAYTVAQTDVVIAGMIIIAVMGKILDQVFALLEPKKLKLQKLYR
ncbi:MAG: ABC transporter permease [Fretibacterium sp.]|nr:ABC transporter permease [Fretibacterium sp.]